jgi:hypothetical protein
MDSRDIPGRFILLFSLPARCGSSLKKSVCYSCSERWLSLRDACKFINNTLLRWYVEYPDILQVKRYVIHGLVELARFNGIPIYQPNMEELPASDVF